jgi:hypothetical protein
MKLAAAEVVGVYRLVLVDNMFISCLVIVRKSCITRSVHIRHFRNQSHPRRDHAQPILGVRICLRTSNDHPGKHRTTLSVLLGFRGWMSLRLAKTVAHGFEISYPATALGDSPDAKPLSLDLGIIFLKSSVPLNGMSS